MFNREQALSVKDRLEKRLSTAVLGRPEVIDLVMIAFLADGHVLLEDYPGSGKTTLARALGTALTADTHQVPGRPALASFRRIQFTPDLLPSDITGSSVFEAATQMLVFRPGPIFAHVVLADEINRTSPKVQAAMLEAMAEKQVTADNHTYPLDELFCVIATQNPLDLVGTYPLPSPQLDRFLFKITMKYLERDAELRVLDVYPATTLDEAMATAGFTREDVLSVRRFIRESVHVAPAIKEALVDLARALRSDARVAQGVSTRSLVMAIPALQAMAFLRGRDFVSPEDVRALSGPLFAHRLVCHGGVNDPFAIVRDQEGPVLEHLARLSLNK